MTVLFYLSFLLTHRFCGRAVIFNFYYLCVLCASVFNQILKSILRFLAWRLCALARKIIAFMDGH